ncbi:hypothetical protein QBC44DRAFT_132946 [Cladorrhinum sp. PSN332]|nr:hypothetical protein QBC44DRAFT_132946 [Cladorrhinum sp. PSN332]
MSHNFIRSLLLLLLFFFFWVASVLHGYLAHSPECSFHKPDPNRKPHRRLLRFAPTRCPHPNKSDNPPPRRYTNHTSAEAVPFSPVPPGLLYPLCRTRDVCVCKKVGVG